MKTITLTIDQSEKFFPSVGEGVNVRAELEAIKVALRELGLPEDAKLEWHLPDVFSIRYGSCYVATARYGNQAVRFVTDEGNWQEGDDK